MKNKFLTLTIIGVLTTTHPSLPPHFTTIYAHNTTFSFSYQQQNYPHPNPAPNNTIIPLINLFLNILILGCLLYLLLLLADPRGPLSSLIKLNLFKGGRISRVYSELSKEIGQVERKIEFLADRTQKLEETNEKIHAEFNKKIAEIQLSLSEMSSKIIQLKEATDVELSLLQSGNEELKGTTQIQYEYKEIQTQTPQISPQEESEYSSLLKAYRENPNSLFHNAIQVALTKETVEKIMTGSWGGVVEFQEDHRRGDYYVVGDDMGSFYLFLNPDTLFNVQTLTDIINKSKIFQFREGPNKSYMGKDITIIKPALVKQENQYWRLVESGEIEFPVH